MTGRMLVAGIGNIFLGDDGFGVEVVRRLAGTPRPPGVEVVDVGIRGVHLAYQLLDGYDVLVLVDAAPRGHAPGTVTLVEVDEAALGDPASPVVDAHGLDPGAVLRMLGSLGGCVGTVYLVACEPESLAEGIGLSAAVEAGVGPAAGLVEELMTRDPLTRRGEEVSP